MRLSQSTPKNATLHRVPNGGIALLDGAKMLAYKKNGKAIMEEVSEAMGNISIICCASTTSWDWVRRDCRKVEN